MAATLKDVAALAGVSVCTASYVINRTGLHKVGEDTQRRIMTAAEKLKYQPSAIGRALKNGRTCLVGAILPAITSSFLPDVLDGLEDCLNRTGYSLILCTQKNQEEFRQKCNVLRKKQVDGAVIVPEKNDDFLRLCDQLAQEIPTAFVTFRSTNPAIVSVCTDGAAVGYIGAKYLLERGHRRICLPDNGDTWRLQGYQRAFAEFGVSWDKSILYSPHTVWKPGAGREMLHYALDQSPRPTAFHLYSDMLAMELLDEALELGFRVPEDFSIIGTDGLAIGELMRPKLTTIAQPRHEQGFKAGELLLAKIDGRPVNNLELYPYLEVRHSVRSLNA